MTTLKLAFFFTNMRSVWKGEHMNNNKKILYYIYRTYYTKNGITYYASVYGKKAWRIPVYER